MKLFSCSGSCYLCVIPLFFTPLVSLEYQDETLKRKIIGIWLHIEKFLGNTLVSAIAHFH